MMVMQKSGGKIAPTCAIGDGEGRQGPAPRWSREAKADLLQCSMTIQDAITNAGATMELAARSFKDKGRKHYSADLHYGAMGFAMAKEVKAGLVPDATNLAAMSKALGNHSAWRQKWEKLGLFPKAGPAAAENVIAELEEEMG